LLAERLTTADGQIPSGATLQRVSESFVADWRRNFSTRIRLSTVVARMAMSQSASMILLPLFRAWPSLLTVGAERVGKVQPPVLLRGCSDPRPQPQRAGI
jgi:hypothetical protein